MIRNDSPPPVSLESALESLATPTAVTDAPADEATAADASAGSETDSTAADAAASAESGVAGTWTLVQSDNSFVGYRVNETLAQVGAATAVGRTSDVEGTLEYDGSAITSVEITADLTTLESDKSMRDDQLRT